MPNQSVCDQEKGWGCDYPHLEQTMEWSKYRGFEINEARTGQVFYEKDKTRLEILYAHDGVSPPVGRTDVNDLSLIMRLTHGATTVLFTGDLNSRLGGHLADHYSDLQSTILKVPHHGTASLAPNRFFEKVAAQVALVPSPTHLWVTERSRQARDFFGGLGTQVYVNGVHGHVTVRLFDDTFQISTQSMTPPLVGFIPGLGSTEMNL